jgi:hypothetical protein
LGIGLDFKRLFPLLPIGVGVVLFGSNIGFREEVVKRVYKREQYIPREDSVKYEITLTNRRVEKEIELTRERRLVDRWSFDSIRFGVEGVSYTFWIRGKPLKAPFIGYYHSHGIFGVPESSICGIRGWSVDSSWANETFRRIYEKILLSKDGTEEVKEIFIEAVNIMAEKIPELKEAAERIKQEAL